MNVNRQEGITFLGLERGELIVDSITNYASKNKLKSSWVLGLGAVKNIELGAYKYSEKQYIKRIFNDEDYELTSLQGNLTFIEDNYFLHSHINISNHNFLTFGGHLFEAEIAVAGEFFIFEGKQKISRTFNEKIGLNLWDF